MTSIKTVPKPWGYELIFAHTDRYVGKVLHIAAGHYRLEILDNTDFIVRDNSQSAQFDERHHPDDGEHAVHQQVLSTGPVSQHGRNSRIRLTSAARLRRTSRRPTEGSAA